MAHSPFICIAPQYLAEEFFPQEGFTEWEYVPLGSRDILTALGEGRADITMWSAPDLVFHLDTKPIVAVAGVHGGCFELFGGVNVRGIRDLKGKTAAVHYFGSGDHIMLSSMLAYVGINPQEDVKWITGKDVQNAMDLFVSGKADAFMGFAQEPVELRSKKIGRMIVSTAEDRPWSQQFCCVVVANAGFVKRNPIATKRALRAVLKATDICAADPQRAARYLAEKQYEPRYPIGLEVMKNSQYTRWREANPEDTLRFHALRLHEVGMIKSEPKDLIARGTDWRFLNELKRELKA